MSWRLGVIGSPIAHSLSPQLHEAGMAIAGVSGTSTRIEVGSGDLGTVAELLRGRFDALSVTMPLKTQVPALCDVLDETAARVGAVNSLLVRAQRVEGANTDGAGFVDALAGELGFDVERRDVVVIGAGGAARSIVDALAVSGAARVEVLGRTAASVRALAAAYDIVSEGLSGEPADLVVNTTPVAGRVATRCLATKPGAVAVDITYEPRVSSWLAQYEESGCRVANGLAMLAYQAARQLSWWFDVPIDGAALLEVVQ